MSEVAKCLGWQGENENEPNITTLNKTATNASGSSDPYVFTSENFQSPTLPHGLTVINVPLVPATVAALEGYGHLIDTPDERCCEKGNFEIVPWPVKAAHAHPFCGARRYPAHALR